MSFWAFEESRELHDKAFVSITYSVGPSLLGSGFDELGRALGVGLHGDKGHLQIPKGKSCLFIRVRQQAFFNPAKMSGGGAKKVYV